MCWVRVEANASATAHRAHGAACFSFFSFFGLACGLGRGPCFFGFCVLAPPFLAIPGGLSGAALSQQRLGFAHGWCTWLWVGSDGCGEGGGKMPLPVFLLFWLCVFCLSPGVLLFFACGGNRPCHHGGSAGFWGFFSFCFSLFCLLGLAGCCLLGTAGATAPATVGAFFCHGWHMLPMLISGDGGGPGHLRLAYYRVFLADPIGLAFI